LYLLSFNTGGGAIMPIGHWRSRSKTGTPATSFGVVPYMAY